MAKGGAQIEQGLKLKSTVRIEQLAKEYREPLLRYFVRKGMTADVADDCVQEVFVRIATVDLACLEHPQAYLFTIASSVHTDCGRRARARREGRHDSIENFNLPCGEPSPARVFETREALARIDRALDELPKRTREIFLLNRLDGLSYTQIAARYAISVGSIEKRMARALIHLRKRLGDDDKAK